MPNSRPNNPIPQAAFYFSVEIDGFSQMSFQEVSGLEVEMELEEIAEGGENRFKHRLPKGTKYNNLVLKRGFVDGDNRLVDWLSKTLFDAFEDRIQTKDVLVTLLDESGSKVLAWNVKNAYPVKLNMSTLNAQESSLAIESIELAYQYFSFE